MPGTKPFFHFDLADNRHNWRDAMKLNTAQRERIEEQLGVEAIPEEHPVTPDLKAAFGDHTFFVDSQGLNIVEPNPASTDASGNVLKLASWTDSRDALQGHEPEVLPITVDFGSDESDPAA
jgi:hypothetical protein